MLIMHSLRYIVNHKKLNLFNCTFTVTYFIKDTVSLFNYLFYVD